MNNVRIDFFIYFLVNLLTMAKSKEIKSSFRICEHNRVIIVYPFQVVFYFLSLVLFQFSFSLFPELIFLFQVSFYCLFSLVSISFSVSCSFKVKSVQVLQ